LFNTINYVYLVLLFNTCQTLQLCYSFVTNIKCLTDYSINAMIKKEEREELKKYLSSDYVNEVHELLKEKNILSRNGAFYSNSMIRRVFNGYSENKNIENAILSVYQIRKNARSVELKTKRKILGLK